VLGVDGVAPLGPVDGDDADGFGVGVDVDGHRAPTVVRSHAIAVT
jgi:hypothetical protein